MCSCGICSACLAFVTAALPSWVGMRRRCKAQLQGGSHRSSCATRQPPRRWWGCSETCGASPRPPAAEEPTVSWLVLA